MMDSILFWALRPIGELLGELLSFFVYVLFLLVIGLGGAVVYNLVKGAAQLIRNMFRKDPAP